jgi:hypothetical protein
MPSGKELEQLPAANIAPGAGKDQGRFQREILEGFAPHDQPHPSRVKSDKAKTK